MRRIYLIFTVLILAVYGLSAQNILFEDDFEPTPVTGWSTDGSPGVSDWQVGTDLGSPGFTIPTHTNYAASNDNACVCDLISDIFYTPEINFTGATGINVSFDSYLPNPYGSIGLTDSKGLIVVLQGGVLDTVAEVSVFADWTNLVISLDGFVTGPAKIGFKHSDQGATTTGWAIDNIVVYSQWDYDLGVFAWTGPATGCLGDNEDVIVEVKNYGVMDVTSFDIYYTLDGSNSTVQTVTQTIPSGGTYVHYFGESLNLSVGVIHSFNATVSLNGANPDQDSNNDSFANNFDVKRYATLPLSFVEGFASDESYYWTASSDVYGNSQFVSETVEMTGNGAIGWVGGINTTTASNAWNDNASYHSVLDITCDGGVVPANTENLELVIKLRQEMHYSELYSWFGVFVNGTDQIANTMGVTNFNPTTQNSDPWVEHTFNLSAYNNAAFTIELKACCQYANDKVLLDDVIIRPRNEQDAGVSAILSPISSCGVSDINNISVIVTNYGVEPISNIEVWYSIDGLATEYFAGTVAGPIVAGGTSAPAFFPAKSTPGLEAVGVHQFTAFTKLDGDIYYPGNDALTVDITNMPVVDDFPYNQDFESDNYWISGGLNSSWEFGTPDAGNPVINAAASGINAWMTNLDGNYNNDENSYLLSPCFDFTTLADPSIDFSLWYNTDANMDGMQLQSSVDNGATWQTVGVLPPPPNNDNWYNNTVSALGMVGWTDNSGAWVTAHYSLDYLSQEPSVRLKFVFASDPDNLGGNPPTVQDYDGVAIDDIVIADPQAANDIRVMEWLNPQSAYYMTAAELVSFRVKNLGTNPITSFNAWYSIDGGATYTTPETFTVSLATNDYANLDFSQLADFATPGTYPCEVVVEIPSDENALNNVITLDVVSYPSITSFPYYEDFQTDDHFWEAGGTYSSWEFGIPVGTTIPGDPEVNPFLDSAWVTNLDGVYNNNEFSWVESPLMDFSSLIMPAITMRIAYDAEGFTSDGANLQYSLAGGTWTTVGTLGVSGNWYINFVDGLGGEPGWTDFSNGWILATHDLPLVLAGQTDVKFRILFGSDGNTVMEGMAFDDVTIFENAPHDLAVTEWLTQGIACGLGDQEIITVKIKNLGYFAESNFDIAYSIVFNGVVVTVNETVSATILQNDSLEYSFVTPADMSAPGVYTCTVEILTTDDEPANNLIGKSLLSSPLVATFPYFESFEGSDGNWVSGGTNSSWELGAPNAGNPFITTAGLGVESWVTNLNGDYNTLENSWVESPCFDFTNVEYPAIQFQYISDCEFFSSTFGFDGSILEYSTDGGYNWTRVGAYGDTANWYNVLQVWGFNNTEAWGAQSAGWVTTGIDMFFLNYEPNVKFRFRFASDSYNYPAGSHYDGFGFDDITVYNNAPFPMDVGISAITATLDGCENQTGYPVTVMIKNYRTDSTLYAGEVIPVSFTYNGGATVLEYFTLPSDLLILQEIAYTFAATIDMPSLGTYPIEATTVLMNDLDNSNDGFAANVNSHGPPTIDLDYITDVSCFGFTDGVIALVNNLDSYIWGNGETTAMISGLAVGTYYVTVTDIYGCVQNADYTVNEPTELVVTYTKVDNVCHNGTDGSIDITVAGGISPYTYEWDDGTLTEDRTGLAAGTYTVTVTDANTCETIVSVTITEPGPFTADIVITQEILCYGGSNGALDVTLSGGTSPFSYLWDNGATDSGISGLIAGTYCVTVTDANNCVAVGTVPVGQTYDWGYSTSLVSHTVLLDVSTQIIVNGATVNPNEYLIGAFYDDGGVLECAGYSEWTGAVTVIDLAGQDYLMPDGFAVGEVLTWKMYRIADGVTLDAEATYDLTGYFIDGIFQDGGISSILTLNEIVATPPPGGAVCETLIQPDEMLVTLSPSSYSGYGVSCNGGADGQILATVLGGIGPYSYSWSNSVTGSSNANLSAGYYDVTVTDANGCTMVESVTLTEPDVLSASAVVTDVLCNGDLTGGIDLTITGGVMPYSYLWNTAAITKDLLNIAAGTYMVTVTDANGCTVSGSYTVNEPPALALSEAITHVLCNGDFTGAIDITVAGGVAPYTYAWSNSEVTEDLAGIAAGTYDVIVTDDNGCTISGSYTVTEPPALALSEAITHVLCNGDFTGAIDLTVSGGVAPYIYAWSNSEVTEDLAGIAAGTYDVVVTDDNGCTISGSFTVTEPPALALSGVVTDVTCNGFSDGSIDLTVSGGVLPYSFAWSNGAASEDLTGIIAGNYDVVVTDANGCIINGSYIVIESILLPLQEDFEAGVLPTGWASTHATPSIGWEFGNDLGTPITFEIPTHTYYAVSNDDLHDDYTALLNDASSDYLITPPMDFTGYSSIDLTFDAFFPEDAYGSVATIEISTDGGVTWTIVNNLDTDPNWQEDLVVSLDAYIGLCNVRLAFHHNDGGNWASGFGIDNVNIIGIVHDLELTAWVSPIGENCGLAVDETVTIQVTNLGAQAATGFDLSYTIDGVGTFTETYNGSLAAGDVLTHTFAPIDLTAFGAYTASASLTYGLDEVSSNNALTGIAFGNHPTISSFPYLEDFEDNDMEYFAQTVGVNATSNIVNDGSNNALVVTGQNPNDGWFGGINATANDAWNLSTSHHVTAINWCSVDATGLTSLELLIDLQQIFANVPNNSWFRVLVNGTQVGPDYSPTTTSDPMVTVQWDLDTYANTVFDLTLQFSNRSLDDKVIIDNILLREKIVDLANVVITSPVDDCSLTATEVVVADIENLGGLTASGFDVILDVDGTITTETYNGTPIVPGGIGTHTFVTTADLSVNGLHSITVTVDIANDVNLANNSETISLISKPYYSTYPFAETDANFGAYWTAGGDNSSWEFGLIGTENYWATGLTGNYNDDELSYVVSPCFNFTSLNTPVIEFDLMYETEPNVDAVVLQYSTDGLIWTTVGLQGDDDNWYNSSTGWTNNSGGIITVRHELFALAGLSQVQFRLLFSSDSNTNMDGVSFNNVEIYEQNDVGAIAYSPSSVCEGIDFNVDITIQNHGYSTIPLGALIDVEYTLNGNTVSESIALGAVLIPGGTAILTFTAVENLLAGNYVIHASATMPCDFNHSNDDMLGGMIEVYPLPIVDLGTFVFICDGSNITFDPGVYTSYLWSDGNTNQDLTVSAAGIYAVTVTDANGCQNSDDVDLGIYALPVVDLGANVDFCDGGSVTLDAGSFAEYLWSDGSTDQALVVFASGNYSVTVTDGNLCQNSDEIVVTVNPIPAADAGINVTICTGESATLTATGADNYAWSTGEATSVIIVAPSVTTTYSVTVTDSQTMCSASDDVTVQVNYGPVIDNAVVTDVTCNGYNDGTITLTISGGLAPYNYTWSNGGNSAALTNLAPGTYSVTITDQGGAGCDEFATYVITEPYPVLVTVIDISQNIGYGVSCYGNSDGNLKALVTNGNTPYTFSWSNGGTTDEIDNLIIGTYSVTVTDVGGCMGTADLTISQPDELTASVTTTNITCYGFNDGTATVAPVGGTPPYMYLWDNSNETTQAIDNLAPGTYSVWVSDVNGCVVVEVGVVVEPDELLLTGVVTSDYNGYGVSCYGAGDGAATVNVIGGISPYIIAWSNGAATASINNLTAGTYTVTVTDMNGCVETSIVEITQPSWLIGSLSSVTYSGYNVSCNGASDGSITVTANGGVAPYTYIWSTGATTDIVSGLAAGSYSVTVTDDNGCFIVFNKTLTEPAILVVNADVFTDYNGEDISCYGGSDGAAIANVTGGATPYTYYWSNTSILYVATGLVAGTYDVTVTDNNGCLAYSSVSLSEPIELLGYTQVTSSYGVYNTHVSCYGATDGTVEVVATGGTGTLYYSWSNAANTAINSNVGAGMYYVTVTDDNSCEYIDSVEVIEPDDIVLTASVTSDYNGSDISCNGYSDGAGQVIAIGGTGTLAYLWSNGETTASISGLISGIYTVTVTDENACSAVASFELIDPTDITGNVSVSSDYNGAAISCFGAADGALIANATGGTGAYTYVWSTGETTQEITGLVAGFYAVTVYDANGCAEPLFKQIIEPDLLIFTPDTSDYFGYNITCFGGSDGWAQVIPAGGTAPYFYIWSDGQTDQTATGLLAGSYDVTVTDVNGCSTSNSFLLTEPISISASVIISDYNGYSVTCFGASDGFFDLTPADGIAPYSYIWDNGETDEDLSGLSAGTYIVTITDDHACQFVYDVILTEPPLFEIDTIIITSDYDGFDISCNGYNDGAVDLTLLTGIAPFTYIWTNGSVVEDPADLSAGDNYVTVTDANGCTVSGMITLNEPDALVATALIASDYNGYEISCPGAANGAATVDVISDFPPYSFLWSNGSTDQIATGLVAGTYDVTVTDAHGCIGTSTVTLVDPPQLEYTASVTNVDCYGNSTGSIDITVTGGVAGSYLYFWSTGANTEDLDNLPAGAYYLLVLDGNWCHLVTEVFIIGQPDDLLANAVVTTDFDGYGVSCFGTTDAMVDLTITGGTAPYFYSWSNSESTEDLTNLGVGIYDVTVVDDNGCETTTSVEVTEPDLFVATAVIDTDYNGYAVSCNGAIDGEISVSLDYGFAPFTYLWSNGSTDAALIGVGVGTYDVTVTDNHGCVSTSSVTLTGADLLDVVANIMSDYNGYSISCNGGDDGEVNTTVTGGTTPFTYLWSNGEITANITNGMAGNNTVTVTDVNGCAAVVTVTLTEPDVLVATADNDTLYNGAQISCYGEADAAIDLTIAGGVIPYSYLWSNGEITEDVSNLGAGTYTVTVTDSNGCEAETSLTIVDPTPVVLDITVFNSLCYGANNGFATATASGGTSPYNYYWSNSETTQSIMGLAPGNYYVFALDANLCQSNTYPIVITEPDELIASATVISDNICYGDTDGEIDLNVSGGSTPYNFNWSNGAITEDLSNLGAGTYTCTISDSHGCTKVVSATITEPAQIILELIESHIDCYSQSTGEIQVTVTNGVQPISYLWSNGETVEDLTGLTGGFYFLTVTDATGCTAISGKFINEPNELVLTLDVTDPLCYGDANGVIDLTVSGGTATYTYSWSNGETTQDISGLTAGFYEVTVVDSHNCTERVDVFLVEPDMLVIDAFTIVDNNCSAGGGGSIDITVVGGTAAYSYSWSSGDATEDISGQSAGTYTVTVTDANNCVVTGSYLIDDAIPISLAFAGTPVSCNGGSDGSIDLTISDGVAPYVVMWSGSGLGQSVPFDWSYTNTGSNHTILIENTVPMNIGGVPIAIGDVIGVFYDNAGTLACGGYIEWTGNSIAIAAWGTEVNMNNGFAANEVFTFKVYRAADGTVFDADVTYITGLPNTDTFVINGISGLASLNAGMSEDLSGLVAGTYTVTVYDAVGCTGVGSYSVSQPTSVLSTIVATNVTCYGEANGSINLTAIGGTPPYTYLWSNGETTQDVDNLTPGSYSVIITDANGCTANNSASITEPDALEFTYTTTDVVCYGENNGTAIITITGGVAPHVTDWAGFDSNALAAGIYTVVVTDANGCAVSHDITIVQPDVISISYVETNISCYGDQDGSIDVTVTGGIAPYVYAWSNGEITEDLAGLDVGTYELTVTDDNLCEMVATVIITQPDELVVTGTVTDLLCFNDPIGAIDVTVVGGTLPYAYAWFGGETTEDLSGLFAGMYSLTVTDANGCVFDISFEVLEPAELVLSGSVTNVTCNGGSDGAVDIDVMGGVLPYSFAWSNGEVSEDIANLVAGTYEVVITDANGCTVGDIYTVTEPPAIVLTYVVTNVSCYGFADGAIDLTVTNGVAPFTYAWTNGEVAEDIAGLVAGVYEVLVTDADGCTASVIVTVTQPDELVLTGVTTDVSCNGAADGSIDITVTGGTLPYSYMWSGLESVPFAWDYENTGTNHTIIINNVTPIDLNGSGIALGDVIGVFYDSLNTLVCAGYVEWTGINTNVAAWGAELNIGTGLTMLNGFAIGEEFSWKVWQASTGIVYNAQAEYLSGLLDSMYYVTDGMSSLTSLTGTIPYEYVGTAEDLFNLAPGAYQVIVTDDHACEVEQEFIIYEPAEITLTGIISDFNGFGVSGCNASDGTIDVTVSGGVAPLTYAWSNGETTEDLTGLVAGTYSIVVTDVNGCNGGGTYEITEFCDPVVLNCVASDVSCNGGNDGSVDLTISGGIAPFAILWSNGETTEDISSLIAGTYSVTVSDAFGQAVCSSLVVEPDAMAYTATIVDITCNGFADGAIDITVAGGVAPYSYIWTNSTTNQDVTLLAAGLYGCQVSDANGCILNMNFGISQPDPIFVADVITDVSFAGAIDGAIDLTLTGGTAPFSFNWSNGDVTEDISGVVAGNYSVTITDDNSCEFITTYTIGTVTSPCTLAATVMTTDNTCYGDADASAIVFATGGTPPYAYQWSNGDVFEFIIGQTGGTYFVTVSDNAGCSIVKTVILVDPDPIIVNITSNPIGITANVVSGAVGSVTYLWSNGKPYQSIKGLTSGVTYCVTVTDDNGCTGTACFTWPAPPTVAFGSSNSKADDNEVVLGQDIKLYPNPTTDGKFYMDLSNLDFESLTYQVIDATGRTIYNQVIVDNNNRNVFVEIENALVGVYHLRVITDKSIVITKRFVILK